VAANGPTKDETVGEDATGATAARSLEASAAALFAANDRLLDRHLATGVQSGILVPYCRGLDASASDGLREACAALGAGAQPQP